MTEFFEEIGLRVTLKEAGITDDRFEEMANKCTDNDNKKLGNFVS